MGNLTGAALNLSESEDKGDTVIYAFPVTETTEELKRYARTVLECRFDRVGALACIVIGVGALMRKRLKRPDPGGAYTFLAKILRLPDRARWPHQDRYNFGRC